MAANADGVSVLEDNAKGYYWNGIHVLLENTLFKNMELKLEIEITVHCIG